MVHRVLFVATVLMVLAGWAVPAEAQVAPCAAEEISDNLPPPDSGPLYRCVQLMAHAPGDRITAVDPMIDAATYASHLTPVWSLRSQNRWMPFNDDTLRTLQSDYWKLWRTEFLEDLWIEVIDEPFENGVMGKHVVFHYEERARVKLVDYVSADDDGLQVDVSKIESTLREQEISVRLDSFVDEASLRKVIGVIRELYAEKGYNDAVVTTERRPMAGGAKLIHLTFKIDPGPKVQVAQVVFDGNTAFSDAKLRGQMAHNKPRPFYMRVFGARTFHEARFAEDAERVAEFYKRNGYAGARVGQPVVEVLRTSRDASRRSIRLRVPIDEGPQYRIGTFEVTGESELSLDAVRALFPIKPGDTYSSEKLRKGIEEAGKAYGAYGFYNFSPEPRLNPRGIDPATGEPTGDGPVEPIMDVTVHMDAGEQFFVNRITFTGNTTTHDAVIRRELRVAEGGVFNAEALKESVRRLNQLGYFRALEGKEGEMDVRPTPGEDNKVDITLKVEEQNRNQLTFGAGVSQFDGVFAQMSFQTSNFLGRGETVAVSLQRGSQARQYQLSFSEPYLFERPITVGADVYSREFVFPLQFTQRSTGTNYMFGFPLADYTRAFVSYSYEQIQVRDVNPIYSPAVLNTNPFLADMLLQNQGGRRTVSKISPSLVFNTVNRPIFPTAGTRYTAGLEFASAALGGNTDYTQTRLEAIWYFPLTGRTSVGLRAEGQYVRPYGRTTTLPIFEKLFSGGEYSVRGFDLRTVAPTDPDTGVLVGGNKQMTFNAEYYVDMFGQQARIVAFFDAGQVRDIGQSFGRWENIVQRVVPPPPFLRDALSPINLLTEEGAIRTEIVGRTSAFKTSTGLELRFMMPVLNIPFRLIAAYNPNRGAVRNHQSELTKRFTFRFAVGTTF